MTVDTFKLVGCVLDEKFRIDAAVAHGGFGVVYRGSHLGLKKPVAVKVLRSPDDGLSDVAALVAQFQVEAELLARLDHPAVVQVLDLGMTITPSGATVPWMALEWVEGRTLLDELRERSGAGGRSPAECMALLEPIVDAVAQAHALGIAHRDIKPGNIMLVAAAKDAARSAARPSVRLLDFGIAKVMAPDELRPSQGTTQTGQGASAFSLRYAAPEQLGGARTGPWTDVHALALVFSHVLTDRSPLEGDDSLTVAVRVLAEDRPTPGRVGVDVGAWEPVLARALSLRPADRFQNAGDFLEALRGALPRAVARPKRRPRGAVLLAVGGALAGAALLAWGPWRDPATTSGAPLTLTARSPLAPSVDAAAQARGVVPPDDVPTADIPPPDVTASDVTTSDVTSDTPVGRSHGDRSHARRPASGTMADSGARTTVVPVPLGE